ncbi:glucan endo-1,3-beta-glucosidase 11-like [Primulina huaijiensis]|uniref:glucan endo-1,3-beta-glucosidase 11-like n=1 Tax=Primulina huaijiensis TaxID=1492673 RepID=UPI003CC7806D
MDLIPLLGRPTSLLIISNITSNILIPASVSVGINYGQIVGYLPHPEDEKPLLKSIGATRMKLYDADPCVLKEFSNSGLEFIVRLGNEYMAKIRDPKQTLSWVKSNVQSYLPSTKIISIVVRNEILSLNDSVLSSNLLPANGKLHRALVSFKCKLAGEEGLCEMFVVIGGVDNGIHPFITDRDRLFNPGTRSGENAID